MGYFLGSVSGGVIENDNKIFQINIVGDKMSEKSYDKKPKRTAIDGLIKATKQNNLSEGCSCYYAVRCFFLLFYSQHPLCL